VRSADGRETTAGQFRQPLPKLTPASPTLRRHELGDALAAVRHQDFLARAGLPDVVAEPVLQLADSDVFHDVNVASCGLMSNVMDPIRSPAAGGLQA
jgi:hypothetical protein